MTSVIIKIKKPKDIVDAAILSQETFGRGGNPEAPIIEEYLGKCNCEPKVITEDGEDYYILRVMVDKPSAQAMEYMKAEGLEDFVELELVEWEGQTLRQIGVDTNGNPEYLGLIGSLPMKPIIEEELT